MEQIITLGDISEEIVSAEQSGALGGRQVPFALCMTKNPALHVCNPNLSLAQCDHLPDIFFNSITDLQTECKIENVNSEKADGDRNLKGYGISPETGTGSSRISIAENRNQRKMPQPKMCPE